MKKKRSTTKCQQPATIHDLRVTASLILDLTTPPNPRTSIAIAFDLRSVFFLLLFSSSSLLLLFLFLFFFSTPISRGAIRSIFPSGRGAGRHRRSRSSSTHIRPGVAQGCVHRPPSARLGWAGVQQPGSRMWRRWMNRAAVCRVERARSALATQTSFLHSGGKVVGVRTIRKG